MWRTLLPLRRRVPATSGRSRRFRRAGCCGRCKSEFRAEVWDADDFDPWKTLVWETVRVIRYRQHKPDGAVVRAYWLTNLPSRRVGRLSLYHMAKSRWEIESQGFNDAKDRYGMEHICHHEASSILRN